MRHLRIELSSPRWQRGVLTDKLMARAILDKYKGYLKLIGK